MNEDPVPRQHETVAQSPEAAMGSRERDTVHSDMKARLEASLTALEASMPGKEQSALADRAMEIFAVRCDIQDLDEENASYSDFTESEITDDARPPVSQEAHADPAELNAGRLKSEFNIDFPKRYPRSVLHEMLEPGASGEPWGIVVVAKYDHNGAFERTPQLADLQTDLGGKAKIRIVEASSAEESAELMERLAGKYGKFCFGVCMAHGSDSGFTFEDKADGSVKAKGSEEETQAVAEQTDEEMQNEERGSENDDEDSGDDSLAAFAKAFIRCSESAATLVMVSCSTGKGSNPIARQLARIMKRKVLAPDDSSNVEAFNATAGGSGISFAPEYPRAATRKFDG